MELIKMFVTQIVLTVAAVAAVVGIAMLTNAKSVETRQDEMVQKCIDSGKQINGITYYPEGSNCR